jgi:DNA repair exonuclease SbcCD ATPase subunit
MQPSEILKELYDLTKTSSKGVEALYEAEQKLAEAEHALDTIESKAFLNADGTVADRQALARLEAADTRLERDLARASVNRIKTKMRTIESAIMAHATMSKLMQAEMKL